MSVSNFILKLSDNLLDCSPILNNKVKVAKIILIAYCVQKYSSAVLKVFVK